MLKDNSNENNKNNKDTINKDGINLNDNGLLPKIWGPPMWESLHSISFYYPLEPTEQDKANYKDFFKKLGEILPCKSCSLSYKRIIETGTTNLNDDVLKSRSTLTKWLYEVHEAVNGKLGVDYGISYQDVVNRYEAYRASCGHTENKNILSKGCEVLLRNNSYKIAKRKICPLIPLKIAQEYINYAKLRGIENSEFYLINNRINKDDKIWAQRNKECSKIINKMREDGIPSIEEAGRWKGLPTIDELQLILRQSSNLSKEKLLDMIKELPKSNKNTHKKYILKR